MRQLRLTRVTDDTRELVLDSVDGLESYTLPVDDTLRAAVAATPVLDTTAPEPAPNDLPAAEITVGPREVQVRIRAGESPQQLADSLGVPLDRVMRFAQPVMDERIRITDEARRARARRAGADGELVQFGEAVDGRFAAHGLVPTEIGWDSRRREDGDWIVTADWAGGEGRHSAEWLFHRSTRLVTALDETASDLLSDRPIRPVVPPAAEPERPDLAAAPPLAPGIVAFPPMPEALTGPLPRYQEVFDQDAPAEGPREVPPLVPSANAFEYDEPPLPLAITDPSVRPEASMSRLTNVNKRRDETEDDKATRARIPSWDDILLGVRRKD